MTPVEEIRRAAALMRERATKAQTSPWTWPDIATLHSAIPEREHVASWHPAAALAVADWLDEEAEAVLTINQAHVDIEKVFGHALAVARAYLGDQP